MKGKWPRMILLVAAVLGLATTYLIYHWMERQTDANAAPRQENILVKPVVVATVDLPPGSKLRPEHLKVIQWPAESLPVGVMSASDLLTDRVVFLPIVAGEPMMESKLAPKGTSGGLTAIITTGKRAMSVKVDEIIGVAGFVMPGSFVDVLVTLEDRVNQKLDAAAQTILQNVRVLTSGQKIVNEKNQPVLVNVVTLEVTPEEAEKLALAANRGRLQLALRNQVDREETQTFAIHTPQLIREQSRPHHLAESPPPPARPLVVEVIRGNKRTNQEF
jgi:pilus assembly protein CpaB